MGFYGPAVYGTSLYGVEGFPASPDFDVFDFAWPTEATMVGLFSFPQSVPERLFAPYGQFVGDDYCMFSDDGVDSGFAIYTSIPNEFYTLQFSILPTQIPDDFSSLTTNRLFIRVYNAGGYSVGLSLSENGGIALGTDPENPTSVLPDSADIFSAGLEYYVFRVTVDATTGEGVLYVTRKDILALTGVHDLRYSFSAEVGVLGYPDHVQISVVGTSGAGATDVCLDTIRLSSQLLEGNKRPVAVITDPDISRRVGYFGYFDGRQSYDPDVPPQPLTHIWTLTDAPEGSSAWLYAEGTSPADPTGYTNYLTAAVGTFTDFRIGDLVVGDLVTAPIVYLAEDGSDLVTARDIFPADATVRCEVLRQVVWGGTRLTGSMITVQSSGTTPPVSPLDEGYYLVTATATGAWAGEEGNLALWSATTGWSFSTPPDETIIYDISARECYRLAGSGLWYADDPRVEELDHWEGRKKTIASLNSDIYGLYNLELTVNDGVRTSLPALGILNAQVLESEPNVIPDMGFIWKNLPGEFWELVDDREAFETFWSEIAQLLAGDLLELWQHQIAVDLFRMQRTFQKHWLHYDLKITMPVYVELPATILNTVDVTGFSTAPNVTPVGSSEETAYSYSLDDGGTTDISVITDSHYLVIAGVAYRILRAAYNATIGSNVVVTEQAMPTGTDRSGYWMIRPTATSALVDFGASMVQAADTAVFEVREGDDITTEIEAFIYGVRGDVLVFDDTDLETYIADEDTSVYLKYVVRRSRMDVHTLIMNIPQLQEVINFNGVSGAPVPLVGSRDYILEDEGDSRVITFLDQWFDTVDRGSMGAYVAADTFEDSTATFTETLGAVGTDLSNYLLEIEDVRYRLGQVLSDTQLELFDSALSASTSGSWKVLEITDPPSTFWAEVTNIDNRPVIERNFGSLIGFGLDVLEARTDDLDYLSAVRGLWYYVWNARTLTNTRIAAQIILGLPFAEADGTILDIREYDLTRTQVIVRDNEDTTIIRSYIFPTVLGLETNPETGVDFAAGDTITKFSPISEGVDVQDYVSDEDWWEIFAGSGDFYEPQKLSAFGIQVSGEVFDLVNLEFLAEFLRLHRVKHRDAYFSVINTFSRSIDIDDACLVGPVVPDGYTYPATWPAIDFTYPWQDAPTEVERATITDHYPTDPPVPLNPGLVPFGNIFMRDAPGSVPDGWDSDDLAAGQLGTWATSPLGPYQTSRHYPTISEGSMTYDETDGSGRYIHRWLDYTENLLIDPNFEPAYPVPGTPPSPWDIKDLGGLGLSFSALKNGPPCPEVDGSTQSLTINGAGTHHGIEQPFDGVGDHPGPLSVDENFQVGARMWIRLITGQAYIRILNQDAPQTVLAEWRHATAYGEWHQVTLHAWRVPAQVTNYLTLQIFTGPAGGEFNVDGVGFYQKLMPWNQWAHDRMLSGRTGGFTRGGMPDDVLEFLIAFPVS